MEGLEWEDEWVNGWLDRWLDDIKENRVRGKM